MSENAYRPLGSAGLVPPGVKNLLLLNGLVFVAMHLISPDGIGPWAYEHLALWPAGTPDVANVEGVMTALTPFRPWQLVTTAFLHADFTHILFNMFGLWMFGMTLEHRWGTKRFLAFYFLCVLGASLAQLAVVSWPYWMGTATSVPLPTVGASGGVLGILAAFGTLFPEQRILLIIPPIPIKAKYFVLILAAIDLYAGVSGTPNGVANFAHLGGMLVGFLLVLYWSGRLPIRPKGRV